MKNCLEGGESPSGATEVNFNVSKQDRFYNNSADYNNMENESSIANNTVYQSISVANSGDVENSCRLATNISNTVNNIHLNVNNSVFDRRTSGNVLSFIPGVINVKKSNIHSISSSSKHHKKIDFQIGNRDFTDCPSQNTSHQPVSSHTNRGKNISRDMSASPDVNNILWDHHTANLGNDHGGSFQIPAPHLNFSL